MKYRLLRYGRTDMTDRDDRPDAGEIFTENLPAFKAWIQENLPMLATEFAKVQAAKIEMDAIAGEYGVTTVDITKSIKVVPAIELHHTREGIIVAQDDDTLATLRDFIRTVVISPDRIYVPGYEGPEWVIEITPETPQEQAQMSPVNHLKNKLAVTLADQFGSSDDLQVEIQAQSHGIYVAILDGDEEKYAEVTIENNDGQAYVRTWDDGELEDEPSTEILLRK